MKETFIIVSHRATQFGNRMLNDLSIAAYAQAQGARFINLTSLERLPIVRVAYYPIQRLLEVATRGTGSLWAINVPKDLPPTAPATTHPAHLFFFGWLFRNPRGLKVYRAQLAHRFAPSRTMARKVGDTLAPMRNKTLIGVHLKLLPFRGFEGGEFLVSPAHVRRVVEEYLHERGLAPEEAGLVIVADAPLSSSIFEDLACTVCVNTGSLGFYLLAACTIVIGTNTTYANTAAWFANVPHIVTTNEPIDWAYYRNKDKWFENKYATFSFGMYDPKNSILNERYC